MRALIAAAFVAAATLPSIASATTCTVNKDNKWSSCTCTPGVDPNCSADWCDGTTSANGNQLTCTFTTPKPRGDRTSIAKPFGVLKGNSPSGETGIVPMKPARAASGRN